MPIVVAFDPPDAGRSPGARTAEFGPYRVASLVGNELMVFDGFQPLTLAFRDDAGGWHVNGLDGLTFESVRFLPPPAERAADLDRAAEVYDEENGE